MTIKHLYPTQRPSLDLNFARTKRLDPRVTFTRGSTATYVGNDGLIKTAVDHEPRFDHDPLTGESLGLLVEESRANLFPYSNFVGWFAYNISQISTNNPAPDGSNTAVLIGNATSTATNSYLEKQVNRTSTGALHTYTAYVKATQSGQKVYFGYRDNGPSRAMGNINLDNGAVSYNEKVGDAFITSTYVGNGWYRCRITCLPSGGTGYYWTIGNYATGDILIWGAQLEESPFPTSYIPTAGSTVTRAADVASLTNTNVYDTDSFTILNNPYGAAGGGSTLNIVGGGQTPVKRTTVYNQDLSQSQINTLVKKDDEFWRWRILGSSFRLPNFTTDGQVTVDWGDGTVETMTTSEHTFTDGGGYHDVGFRLDSGTYFRPYINNNATHKDKVIALGPAPESMKLNGERAFYGCANFEAFDATVDATGGTNFTRAWGGCSSLTSFPLIDTSSGTNFTETWNGCSSLTSFPLIDTSSGTNFSSAWRLCSSLTSFPLIDTSSVANFQQAWENCSSLTSFPAIDTSSATSFTNAWNNCSSLTSFPLIDTSSGTTFQGAWAGCNSLTSFPLLDTSSGTNFFAAWYGCSSLTSFPLIDTSSGTNFQIAWRDCSSLTSFPLIDTSSGTNFDGAWRNCNSLTSFPLINISSGTDFGTAWYICSSLTTFPANFFDSWTGTPSNGCFNLTWAGCSSLTATSVENILNSIDTSGQSAPAGGVDITIDYDAGTGTPSVSTAVTNLKSRGWTITLNGVAQ